MNIQIKLSNTLFLRNNDIVYLYTMSIFQGLEKGRSVLTLGKQKNRIEISHKIQKSKKPGTTVFLLKFIP